MFKVGAAVILFGLAAYTSSATEITENFAGITSQVAGDLSGIFNVNSNSSVYGTLEFDPSAFSPNPVVPSGSSFLDVFVGGPGSVSLALRDHGGSAGIDALSAFLEVSSSQIAPWDLLITGDNFSFSVVLQPAGLVVLTPGTSLFNFAEYGPSTTSILVSDSASSLNFAFDSPTVAPEPGAGILFLTGCAALLAWFRRRELTNRRRRTIPGLRIPKPRLSVY